jgi:4-amino-4-deoxy-L-arabinose transferase-like glycosyltransferase
MSRASLWRWVLMLWATSTLCALLLRPVTPIDETRYLAVAWEMRLAGDPWLPTLNDQPYSDKPPLLFWMINAGWSLFGVDDLWPRLLTAMFGLGVALLTARCAVLLCDGRPGIGSRAALVLMALSPWLLFNGSVMFDVLLTFFSLAAIVLVLGINGSGILWQWSAIGVALGLGMLAKGPAVLVHALPVAVLAPLWKESLERLIWRDRLRWYRRLLFALGISVAVLAMWLVPAISRGGDEFLDQLIWQQTIYRMASTVHHLRPVWFYIAMLPVLLFPLWLLPASWKGLTRIAHKYPALGPVLLSWTVPVFLAFSSFKGKQLHYVFPLLPAVAVWLAAVSTVSSSGYKKC